MKRTGAYYLFFMLAGVLTTASLYFGTAMYLNAVSYAETARGVDVYLVTTHNTVTTGIPFTADVFITNDSTPLNVMEAEILFDPSLFAVTSFSFGDSLCEERFIIDNEIDNTNGRIHVSCGTVTPFAGNATIFGTVTAVPLQPGITDLTFGEKTHVFIHDGLGTEIARDTYGATVVVNAGV